MNKRILIVDDNPWNTQLVAEVLTRQDFVVETALRGDVALGMIAADRPDMVLLDIMLPDVNGMDIAKELRETYTPEELPIVAMTALNNTTTKRQCKEIGFNEIIVKPVTNREVVECVKRYV
ncbi:response regulator [Phototrophicus methaneseepsis]|uniref:Response regulator n=1 Tax=Phototrophicus methaneseepsis TaxID=2710758 RepID=A0A7S8IGQ8_9CHLR|nr:response regulator [Phototrophicus methaneseepsis]QPC84914.1 response regulator [Phototrophicus methaneseepsis]